MGMPKPEMLRLIPMLPTLCKMSERETIVPMIGTGEATQKKRPVHTVRITGRSLVSCIYVKDEVRIEERLGNTSAAPRQP